MGTTFVPSKTLHPTLKVLNAGIWFFEEKDESQLCWQQYSRCHSVSFVMHISGAKFEGHCSNISGNFLIQCFYCLTATT